MLAAASDDEPPAIAFVGRPNVGKSSLLNALLGEERTIVSDVPGTTRDAIDTTIAWGRTEIVLIDTAGIKPRGKVASGSTAERYSTLRSLKAISRADVAVLLIDAVDGLTAQDAHIAGYVVEEGKGLVVAVNKWDAVEDKKDSTFDQYVEWIRHEAPFLDFAPIVSISAKTGQRIQRVLELAVDVWAERRKRVPVNSNEASAVPVDNIPPDPPTNLAAADHPNDQGFAIDLTWTRSISTDVTQQRLYRSTTAGSGYVLIATIADNATTAYTDAGLTNGTTYYYVIRAFDATQESANSTEANAAPVDNIGPDAPTNLAAADHPNDQGFAIDLTWTRSGSIDVTEQRIYRSLTAGGSYTLIATIPNNTTAAYTDTGLANFTTYYYVIRAFDATQESVNSNEAFAVPVDNIPPAPPTGLNATDRPNDQGFVINLAWTPSGSTNVTEQRLYRSTTAGGGYVLLRTFAGNATSSYTDVGLTNGTTYYYIVRAFDATQESLNSNEASATPLDNLAPLGPTGLAAVDHPNDQGFAIDLSWNTSPEADVAGYRLFRSTVSGGSYAPVTGGLITGTSYTDSGLTNGTAYFYVLTAVDTSGNESPASNQAQTAPVDNLAPAAPTNLTAVDRPNDQGDAIDLAWTPSASADVTAQRVYRATTAGGSYTLVATLAPGAAAYTDAGLTKGTAYFYVVRAFDGAQESVNSNEASATPVDNLAPVAPTALAVTDHPNDQGVALDLTWTPSTSTDVVAQRIYRSLTAGSGYALVATLPGNTQTAYTDTGLSRGTTYYYVVRAWDGTNESADSNQGSGMPLDNIPPDPPGNLTATDRPGDQGGAIELTWAPNTEADLAGYFVYRSTVSGSGYLQLTPLPLNVARVHGRRGDDRGHLLLHRPRDGHTQQRQRQFQRGVRDRGGQPRARRADGRDRGRPPR